MTKDTEILARRSLVRLAGGALLIGSISLMSAGCSDDAGPAEEAGRELDEAVESAEDSMSRTAMNNVLASCIELTPQFGKVHVRQ